MVPTARAASEEVVLDEARRAALVDLPPLVRRPLLEEHLRGRVAELFGPVTRIPTTFVFGCDGRPALHFIHLRGADKTHASLDELRAAVAAAL